MMIYGLTSSNIDLPLVVRLHGYLPMQTSVVIAGITQEALPSKDDTRYFPLLGEYAKKYYNTHLGKATASKYVMDYLDWRDS